MTSLRNALHRRNHRERSQLAHRAKYGLLEKHKDYVLRAHNYHAKQAHLNHLRQKAANRNKDEFYFAMKHERTVEGVHVKDRGNPCMPMDMVKLLKSQDQGYIRTAKAVGLKKIDKIKRQLTDLADLVSSGHAADVSEDDDPLAAAELETLRTAGVIAPQAARKREQSRADPKHIVFAEDAAEAQKHLKSAVVDKVASNMNSVGSSDASELGWKVRNSIQSRRRRKKRSTVDGTDSTPEQEHDLVNVKHRKHLLKELAARLARDTQLSYALRELEMQRLLAGKGGRKKIRGAERVEEEGKDSPDDQDHGPRKHQSGPSVYKPRVYKWRVERKR